LRKLSLDFSFTSLIRRSFAGRCQNNAWITVGARKGQLPSAAATASTMMLTSDGTAVFVALGTGATTLSGSSATASLNFNATAVSIGAQT
jgi:hypothetical protein